MGRFSRDEYGQMAGYHGLWRQIESRIQLCGIREFEQSVQPTVKILTTCPFVAQILSFHGGPDIAVHVPTD